MVKAIILGHGMVANHLLVGLERIKSGEIPPYGVPLANYDIGIGIDEIEIVGSYDVDREKVGKDAYTIALKAIGDEVPIPRCLSEIRVRMGVHLRSLEGLPFETISLEDKYNSLTDIVEHLVDEWREMDPDVIVNMLTTEHGEAFKSRDDLFKAIEEDRYDRFSASQLYAYAAYIYSKRYKPISFVNVIPVFLANDNTFVSLYEEVGGIILGDDGATGATPLTADLLEHMAERNRRVKYVVQFNIGGNMDFLALTIPEKNVMKELTKSSIVEDILGYDVENYIKPTGYIGALGDRKFVSINMEYETFNGLKDEIFVNVRINDSPALAGMVVDLIRLSKICLDRGLKGTIYPINAFFMKKPGPLTGKSISKIVAFRQLLEFLNLDGGD